MGSFPETHNDPNRLLKNSLSLFNFKFYSYSKTGNRNVKPVLPHCCKTSWIALLRVLPPMFEPVLQQIRLRGFFFRDWQNAQHGYSTRFSAMLQNKLHVFQSCQFYRTLSSNFLDWTDCMQPIKRRSVIINWCRLQINCFFKTSAESPHEC